MGYDYQLLRYCATRAIAQLCTLVTLTKARLCCRPEGPPRLTSGPTSSCRRISGCHGCHFKVTGNGVSVRQGIGICLWRDGYHLRDALLFSCRCNR
ncbi:uncharacterized protein YALI1_F10867g [Yarrowia lipolytica]|uniref:Uncharacterized protein n=1 Tax=Yarrowia lipolytica TaxID=4952 RepID=A0A1D8NME6_YARLL|nr:hypothetical protein YALI1_F10867g [Yarrowia lipolytica]